MEEKPIPDERSGRTLNYLSVFFLFLFSPLPPFFPSMETRNGNRKINTIANLANRGSIEVKKERKKKVGGGGGRGKTLDETLAFHLNRERIIFLITRVISQSRTRRNGRRKKIEKVGPERKVTSFPQRSCHRPEQERFN